MGLTYEQAKSLGIGHLHPAESGEIKPRSGGLVLPAHGSTKPDDGMNKTERAFSEVLVIAKSRGLISDWDREAFKIRLAGRTWYTPDFLVWSADGFTFVEVKGFMRDDAAVKLKVAARLYPQFRWLLVRRAGRIGWAAWDVTGNGINTIPTCIPWIG